jgi:S-adenosylmethionine hydrolase
MDNVPKKALSRLNGESDEVQEVSINGKREQVKVVKTFPDGRKVVEINGEQKIIDPR